ncbi:glycosyltransferase family 2 protein [Rhizobium alvei]|uniref:Glycosyltransferase family 2 protein n=1 Tax=Rhizobium alvei TaxID=1132659 RepID=A0ABT8YGB4_9HYPH|nr:glycosyltransferase family 2 protein [Rhizobium alvei]MDO6962702.1 glycosyltransferase family 2 protein [Rhizobium alvei]
MSDLRKYYSVLFKRYLVMRRHRKELRISVDKTKKIRSSDILLVMCLRNELTRLPFFCDYYRKLGVNHFLIVDNDSTDGLTDWANEQPDISVWHTKASYKASKFGMEWCNYLLTRYGMGHLCVTVDPDEFLVYPKMETRSLRDLGDFMKMEKREALQCVMLDAYSDKPLQETIYRSGQNPFEVCPFFDKDGYIQTVNYNGGMFTQGGPRMRVHNAKHPQKSPALNKTPVVWWGQNFRYTSSMHDLMPARLVRPDGVQPAITGALFHFKFFASLTEKAAEEMARKQHYAGGQEYRTYLDADNPVLYEPGISVRYENPEQLISLALISRGNWL